MCLQIAGLVKSCHKWSSYMVWHLSACFHVSSLLTVDKNFSCKWSTHLASRLCGISHVLCAFFASLNFLSQYGLISVCILTCLFKWFDSLNFLSHIEQLKGLSFVWICSCFFKFPHRESIYHICCTYKVSHQYEFFDDSSNVQIVWTSSHIANMDMVSHWHGFFHVLLKWYYV